jgi:hypothetical protein
MVSSSVDTKKPRHTGSPFTLIPNPSCRLGYKASLIPKATRSQFGLSINEPSYLNCQGDQFSWISLISVFLNDPGGLSSERTKVAWSHGGLDTLLP